VITRYTYEQSIAQLEELYHLPFVPAARAGLRRCRRLLDELGHPEQSFRTIHVTGSTGKGSTTSMIGSILEAAGFRTGYFRSPHLQSYTERVALNGEDISEQAWEASFNQVWPVVEAMRENRLPGYDLGRPSLFEVLFALMAVYLRDVHAEWAAVETGLGGRLDPTNVLQPDVAVVTNVSLEHTQILGSTVREIAIEKAAIIKPSSAAVTASTNPEALSVIEERARAVEAPLTIVGRDVSVDVRRHSITGQDLALRLGPSILEVALSLAGTFQATNAATAFAALKALPSGVPDGGPMVEDAAIVQGLGRARLPGRFELISRVPMVLVDGAHNPAGARELACSVRELVPDRRIVLLLAAMADKDLGGIAEHLGPLSESIVLTRAPGTERAASVDSLVRVFGGPSQQVAAEDDVDRALGLALERMGPQSLLLVTGSLYLVGYVRHRILEKGLPA